MPTFCSICRQRLIALIRALARGESGTLIAWTPFFASSAAPASSFSQSNPLGGTISTIVTNSPCAIRRPTPERSASGRASTAGLASPFTSAREPA